MSYSIQTNRSELQEKFVTENSGEEPKVTEWSTVLPVDFRIISQTRIQEAVDSQGEGRLHVCS